jgi:hypothetical protein
VDAQAPGRAVAETAVTVARRAFAEHMELGDQIAIAHPAMLRVATAFTELAHAI